MCSKKRWLFNLIFCCLVSLVFFTSHSYSVRSGNKVSSKFQNTSYSLSSNSNLLKMINAEKKKINFKVHIRKIGKKSKKWIQILKSLRHPSRSNTDIFGIQVAVNYSNPHFLSLLHHFLFRLTPF